MASGDPYSGVDPKSFLEGLVEGYNKKFDAALSETISSLMEINLAPEGTPDSELVKVELSELIEKVIQSIIDLSNARRETDRYIVTSMVLHAMVIGHVFNYDSDAIAEFIKLNTEPGDGAPIGAADAVKQINDFGQFLSAEVKNKSKQ